MEVLNYILASSSPRRNEMMAWLDLDFKSLPAMIDESTLKGEEPLAYVQRLAKEKAEEIASDKSPENVILAADTIVVFNNSILGKPANKTEAFEILESLSGNTHQVITAIHIIIPETFIQCDVCTTKVEMRPYTDEEIQEYVNSEDPMDKAGAYAIQNTKFHPVVNFNGCFASVMGFPFCHIERKLRSIDGYNNLPTSKICQANLNYECSIFSRVLSGENVG